MAKDSLTNAQIAELLRSVAAAYEVKSGNRFKVVAYENAATSVEHATSELKDLWEEEKLDTVPGLGKSMQAHLGELFKTGKVKYFETLFKGLPKGMFEILGVPGIGPKKAYKLSRELKIESVADLEKAAKKGKIAGLEGFGSKSEEVTLRSIDEFKRQTGRMTLPVAFPIAKDVVGWLKKSKDVERAEPLGSLRRMVSTVGDIDIAVASKNPHAV
ncbi:MAG TPA: helix-hairpin-helix domain-containing protein, partial [Patescibacteria group bacterium]